MQLPSFHSVSVLVVGDIMLDRYWFGTTSRISPEAPVPIVQVRNKKECPGGAGNVALNIAKLGAKVDLIGFCGEDKEGDILEKKLMEAGVNCYIHRIPDLPTITKLRVLSLHQQLIRLDFEEPPYSINYEYVHPLFQEKLRECDVVILSDYAKGSSVHAKTLVDLAVKTGKPIFVDPKGTDFTLYKGATVLTPNLREFEAVVGPCTDEHVLLTQGLKFLNSHACQALLITQGEKGMALIQKNQPSVIQFPAMAKQVYDVTGAGDTVIACLALTYVIQKDLVLAAQIANIAAGIVVGKLGASSVSPIELRRVIQIQELTSFRGILTEAKLKKVVEGARANNERIVMTGGCFDILHAGHVACLEQAKRLGTRLIVAVNDDCSVTKLKGAGRPINTLSKRMSVLAGLRAVDWVISFSETKPERLIKMVLPDIWVKGGDYLGNNLPEEEIVKQCGGQVKFIDFVDGCSTTAIISAVQTQTSRS